MTVWTKENCPVCEGKTGGKCQSAGSQIGLDAVAFKCTACGYFEVTRTAISSQPLADRTSLTKIQRASLSHAIRRNAESGKTFVIDGTWLGQFLQTAKIPSPVQQATNLVRAIGEHITETGEPFPAKLPATCALMGSPDTNLMGNLFKSLKSDGVIVMAGHGFDDDHEQYGIYDLSLAGWRQFEEERKGQVRGSYGFIAMKFGDGSLETLVRETIKPGVEQGTGYPVFDVRDHSKAGVIDNILREQIRDAAFVLVDLSHDNNGAYWEAGYAEGLGKPVIYICEKGKFETARTHFDTNHCTTVMWTADEPHLFTQQLVATIRRSLGQ